MSSTWGKQLKITLFGESHSQLVGVTIQGLPCGFRPNFKCAEMLLERRKAKCDWDTARHENDAYRIVSGITDGYLNGFPMTVLFENKEAVRNHEKIARPSHCEYALTVKYGERCDISGGGHLSARLTLPLTFVGGVCMEYLKTKGIGIVAHLLSVGSVSDASFEPMGNVELCNIRGLRVVDESRGIKMAELLEKCTREGDSVGGSVECMITGLSAGLGEPIFDGIDSILAQLMFAIPAVKSFEMGDGSLIKGFGSRVNDGFCIDEGEISTLTNHSGGVNGGITNGMPLLFRTGFRPIPTIKKEQSCLDLNKIEITKRMLASPSDVCAAVRGTAVVEGVAAIAAAALLANEGEL